MSAAIAHSIAGGDYQRGFDDDADKRRKLVRVYGKACFRQSNQTPAPASGGRSATSEAAVLQN